MDRPCLAPLKADKLVTYSQYCLNILDAQPTKVYLFTRLHCCMHFAFFDLKTEEVGVNVFMFRVARDTTSSKMSA